MIFQPEDASTRGSSGTPRATSAARGYGAVAVSTTGHTAHPRPGSALKDLLAWSQRQFVMAHVGTRAAFCIAQR